MTTPGSLTPPRSRTKIDPSPGDMPVSGDSSTKAIQIQLSREASRALQGEMMRRLERGHCPAPAALVAELEFSALSGVDHEKKNDDATCEGAAWGGEMLASRTGVCMI